MKIPFFGHGAQEWNFQSQAGKSNVRNLTDTTDEGHRRGLLDKMESFDSKQVRLMKTANQRISQKMDDVDEQRRYWGVHHT